MTDKDNIDKCTFIAIQDIGTYNLTIIKGPKTYFRTMAFNVDWSENKLQRKIDENFDSMLRKIERSEKQEEIKQKVLSVFKRK